MTTPSNWLDPLRRRVAESVSPRGMVLALPAYRPDLSRAAAEMLGYGYCDFRAEVMARAGADLAGLPLSLIDDTIASMAGTTGLVLQNVEALLAVSAPPARRQWLASFVGRSLPVNVILPMVLFVGDLPDSHDVVTVAPEAVPDDSLMMRLWAAR